MKTTTLAAIATAIVAATIALPATAHAQSACADLGGTVDPDQICHVHSATSSYKVDFSFPVDYPDQQALTDYLTQQRDQLVSWVAQHRSRSTRCSNRAPNRWTC